MGMHLKFDVHKSMLRRNKDTNREKLKRNPPSCLPPQNERSEVRRPAPPLVPPRVRHAAVFFSKKKKRMAAAASAPSATVVSVLFADLTYRVISLKRQVSISFSCALFHSFQAHRRQFSLLKVETFFLTFKNVNPGIRQHMELYKLNSPTSLPVKLWKFTKA